MAENLSTQKSRTKSLEDPVRGNWVLVLELHVHLGDDGGAAGA